MFSEGMYFWALISCMNSNQRTGQTQRKFRGFTCRMWSTSILDIDVRSERTRWFCSLRCESQSATKSKSQNSDECKKNMEWILNKVDYFLMPASAWFFLYKNRTLHVVLVSTFLLAALPRIWVEQWHVNMLMILLWYSENFWRSSISRCQVEKGLQKKN